MSDTPEQIAAREAAAGTSTDGGGGNETLAGMKTALHESRKEAKALREQNTAFNSRFQALEQKQADEETKRLASANDFKALYEKTETEKQALLQTNANLSEARKRDFISRKLNKEFPTLKDHYIEKLFPFDRVKVDEKGTLNGFQEAVDLFKTENADLVGAPAATGTQQSTQAATGTGEKNAFEKLQEQLRADAAVAGGGTNGAGNPGVAQKTMQATRQAIIDASKKLFPVR